MASLHPNKALEAQRGFIKRIFKLSQIECIALNNVNFNYDVDSDLISRVLIWFDVENEKPICVTKIIADQPSKDKYHHYKEFINSFNLSLGYRYFLDFEIVSEAELNFIFMEFVNSQTYEQQLKKYINGPAKNYTSLNEVINKQVSDLKLLFSKCQKLSAKTKKISSSNFRKEILSRWSRLNPSLNPELLDASGHSLLEEVNYGLGFSIPDLVNPNIFEGPLLIDNIIDDPEFFSQFLGVELNPYRYILLSLISPPLSSVGIGLGPSIMVLLSKKTNKEVPIIGPYAKLLSDNSDQNEHITKFIDALIYEFFERSKIFKNAPIRLAEVTSEFQSHLESILNFRLFDLELCIQELRNSVNRVNDQNYIIERSSVIANDLIKPSEGEVSSIPSSDRSARSDRPKLLFEYQTYNVVAYSSFYYALAQSAGPVDLERQSEIQMQKLIREPTVEGLLKRLNNSRSSEGKLAHLINRFLGRENNL
ncbi:hypothetical protein N9M22_06645 [Litoricolaceae bacterium]|nr:hypothetical protein [Litorivicinaceae bacterium]